MGPTTRRASRSPRWRKGCTVGAPAVSHRTQPSVHGIASGALPGGLMTTRVLVGGGLCILLSAALAAQNRPVARPPAQVPVQPPPGESAAPDGYQPLPQWLG